MVNQAYVDYITSDTWKEKAREVRLRAGYECEECGMGGCELQVHHKHYDSFGNEDLRDLQCLCIACHRMADRRRKRRKKRQIFEAQLNGWGRKVYGDDWEWNPGYEVVEERFENWLAAKGYA